jgi:hypothetical protein
MSTKQKILASWHFPEGAIASVTSVSSSTPEARKILYNFLA